MKNQTFLYGIIGLLLGIILTTYIASSAVNNNQTSMMRIMGMGTNNQRGLMMTNIDRHFIEEMIPHHEGAIDMAKLALTRDTQPEIKTLANDIIKSQTDEIVQMRTWYKSWFGADVPEDTDRQMGMGRGMMHGGMMGDETDISSLEKTENFDKAFIDEMIPHHQMAVMMANMLLSSTNRQEMKKLGEDIVKAQNKEIEDMRQWYKEWGLE